MSRNDPASGGPSQPSYRVVAGSAFDAIVAVSLIPRLGGVPAGVAEATRRVGDDIGGLWTYLLGLALELGPPHDLDQLIDRIDATDGVELRRLLLGFYVPDWERTIGSDLIAAAAEGDAVASAELLETEDYYSGFAGPALTAFLSMPPNEAPSLISEPFARLRDLGSPSDSVALASAAAYAEQLLSTVDPIDAIEQLTGGFRYETDPRVREVVVTPHLAPHPFFIAMEHRDAQIIVFAAADRPTPAETMARVSAALSDPSRVEILGLIGSGTHRLGELMGATGLARSTVHHHLGRLRRARLITIEGSSRHYRYLPRRAAVDQVAAALRALLG